jgi:hypothetical protein
VAAWVLWKLRLVLVLVLVLVLRLMLMLLRLLLLLLLLLGKAVRVGRWIAAVARAAVGRRAIIPQRRRLTEVEHRIGRAPANPTNAQPNAVQSAAVEAATRAAQGLQLPRLKNKHALRIKQIRLRESKDKEEDKVKRKVKSVEVNRALRANKKRLLWTSLAFQST